MESKSRAVTFFSALVIGGHQQPLSSGHLTLKHPTKVTSRLARSFFFVQGGPPTRCNLGYNSYN